MFFRIIITKLIKQWTINKQIDENNNNKNNLNIKKIVLVEVLKKQNKKIQKKTFIVNGELEPSN